MMKLMTLKQNVDACKADSSDNTSGMSHRQVEKIQPVTFDVRVKPSPMLG